RLAPLIASSTTLRAADTRLPAMDWTPLISPRTRSWPAPKRADPAPDSALRMEPGRRAKTARASAINRLNRLIAWVFRLLKVEIALFLALIAALVMLVRMFDQSCDTRTCSRVMLLVAAVRSPSKAA